MPLEKPESITETRTYYNFFSVMNYLQEVYGFDRHSHNEFWDWLNEDSMNVVNNGCHVTLCTNPDNFYKYYYITDIDEVKDEYEDVVNMISYLWREYGLNEMNFLIRW